MLSRRLALRLSGGSERFTKWLLVAGLGVALMFGTQLTTNTSQCASEWTERARKDCRSAATSREHPQLTVAGIALIVVGLIGHGIASRRGSGGSRRGPASDPAVLAALGVPAGADRARPDPDASPPDPELDVTGIVADAAGAVWWFDLPMTGPSRIIASWSEAESMRVLIGIAGSWTQDLGIHTNACDLTAQLPTPRACICIAPATVRDAAAPPVKVRLRVDLPGEQPEARLVA